MPSKPLAVLTDSLSPLETTWVHESNFGRRFLGSRTWYREGLCQAFANFAPLLESCLPEHAAVFDAGCGEGLAFKLIERHLKPKIIFGLDIDKELIGSAIIRAGRVKTPTHVMQGDASLASFRDNTFDIIFAHHILHHTEDQTSMLQKFIGLLKPGGLLLSAESCRVLTELWRVKLLFRHPSLVQKTAQDYLNLIREVGFHVDENRYLTTRPWWSRRTLGLAQKIGIPNNKEPAQIFVVAQKPYPIE